MKTGKRHIKNGNRFDYLFPIPKGENKIIKRVANLDDTILLMKEVTETTLEDTLELSKMLKADTQKQTCLNIWNFCFNHLQYTKDEMGKEQVRRPSRVWRDREQGVDCDCMSVFIGSILTNVGIPYSIRLTKYSSVEFEHVYPIAHITNGVLILDAVVHKFNREVQYSAKKDIKMELQYLNGLGNPQFENEDEDFDEFDELDEFDEIVDNDYPMDAQGLLMDDLQGLEGRAERRARRAARKAKRKEKRANFKKLSFKEKLKKGFHFINRINPGAALLRLGVLASMKLNVMKVASKLRFGYWTDQEAKKNNMDLGKFNQLKRIREKIEKIFFGAGGKTDNLKKAILTGKGNRDRRVVLNGLGEIINPIHDEDDLKTILGDDIYYDEFDETELGVNGLGAVATGSAIAAASGLLGTIATLIKKLGSLFKKGSPQAQQEILQENTEDQEEKTRKFSLKNLINNIRNKNNNSVATITKSLPENSDLDTATEDYSADVSNRSAEVTPEDNPDADPDEKKGIVGWIKENPLLTAGIATAAVGGTILVVRAVKKKKGLSGVPKNTKKKYPKAKTSKPSSAKPKVPAKKSSTKRKRKTPTRRRSSVRKIELL